MLNNPLIYYQNLNSLRSKINNFRQNFQILAIKPDIILFVETNFNNNIQNSVPSLNDYSIFKKDRHSNSVSKKGGGILIVIKKNLPPRIIHYNYHYNCEQFFVKVFLDDRVIIIGLAYLRRHPECLLYCTD